MKKGFSLIEMIVVVGLFTLLFAAILAMLASSDRTWHTGQNKLVEQREARRAMDTMVRLLRQASPDWIITELNPDGTCQNKIHNPVTITQSGERIDFYKPVFYPDCCPNSCQPDDSVCRDGLGNLHSAGEIRVFKITFKINPDNPEQALKKEGVGDAEVLANELDSATDNLKFTWQCNCDPTCINGTACGISNCNTNCTGCTSCCDCYYRNSQGQCVCCPDIEVQIKTKKETKWAAPEKLKAFELESGATLRNQKMDLSEGSSIEEPAQGEF